MAKTTQATLIWLQENQRYLWRDATRADGVLIPEESETWLQWLAERTAFSFQGREGQLTLLKEARPRGGDGYWYAYRRQGKRTLKKYAGRTADLTFARLEQTARALMSSSKTASRLLPQQEPLLIPKLHLPRLHSMLIMREHLLNLLDRGLEHRLTLIAAPAGFGKTTLVRQWVDERTKKQEFPPVAWVSLDAGDNDPVRFWRYLLTASQTFCDDLAQTALALLQTAPQPPFETSLTETVVTVFLNALAQYGQSGIVILDDYHVITSPQIQKTMAFFLEYLPAGIHVYMITRSDPPFPLARLQARNELYEVRTGELRFSLEETAAFLQQVATVSPAPAIVQRINSHLEGWVAGLRLLPMLRERTMLTENDPFLKIFKGDGGQRTLQDYFIAEVLHTQPEPLQQFLLQTSVLSRLTSSLCNAVTGEQNSEQMLASLERANIFLEPLDTTGQWYRYHGLFAEAMQQEARRRLGEATLRGLSMHASHWYEAHNLHTEAVGAALHAQDYARAAILSMQILEDLYHDGQTNEYHTLYTWLEQIPEEILKQHPVLCLGYAMAVLFIVDTWTLAQATQTLLEKFLQMAEQGFRAKDNFPKLGEVFAFRSLVAWRQNESDRAADDARQALLWLSEEQLAWRNLGLTVVGKSELLRNGQVAVARKILEEAYTLCERIDNQYFKRATGNMLATAMFESGELHRASVYYHKALREARKGTYKHSIAHSLSGLARICYEWNDVDAAYQNAQEVLVIGQSLVDELHQAQATLLLARVQHARGETTVASQRLTIFLARMSTIPTVLFREIMALQARLALANGDLAAVQRWIADPDRASAALPPFIFEHEALIVARWHLIQGSTEEALEILHAILPEAQRAGRRRNALEIQVVLALTYAAQKQGAKALQILQDVCTQTHSEGYLRLFLDEGEAMAALLRALVFHVRENPSLFRYLQTILHSFPAEVAPSVPPLLEPLSAQEQRVLRLLASGQSNADIARDLIVSVNTVRTQVQSIYRKLDVHNRVKAGEVARQLRLV